MVAAPAEDSDHEVNTGTRKATARQKQKQFIRCDYTSQFVSETHYWVLSGRKTKPIRHPWENYSLFSLDSLYRCASAARPRNLPKKPAPGESAASVVMPRHDSIPGTNAIQFVRSPGSPSGDKDLRHGSQSEYEGAQEPRWQLHGRLRPG